MRIRLRAGLSRELAVRRRVKQTDLPATIKSGTTSRRLALLAKVGEGFVRDFLRRVGPDDGGGKIAKGNDAGFAFGFAERGKHPAQAEVKIAGDDISAARFGAEDGAFRQLLKLVRG